MKCINACGAEAGLLADENFWNSKVKKGTLFIEYF
jgi:hypothetical protein